MEREDEEHEHQIFRGQIAYATIIQNGQVSSLEAPSGTEQLRIPNISRLDDLCYDNEKHSWWMLDGSMTKTKAR